jgi:hypothetical protein
MKRVLALLLMLIAVGVSSTWLMMDSTLSSRPSLSGGISNQPSGPRAAGSPELALVRPSSWDSKISHPAAEAVPVPEPEANQSSSAAQPVFVIPLKEPSPDLSGELPTLEARWQELRTQGRWREAQPLWERIKLLRAQKNKVDSTYSKEELEWVGIDADDPILVEPKGAWGPATPPRKDLLPRATEPPRLDLLPGSLPGARVERASEPQGSLRVSLTCIDRHPANSKIIALLYDANGHLIGTTHATADAEGVVVFESVPTRTTGFEVWAGHYDVSTRETCVVRRGEQTDWGRLTLTAKSNG